MRCKWLAMAVIGLFLCTGAFLRAATYQLSSGQTVSGEPLHYDATGVVFRYPDGRTSARLGWTNFTEGALKEFAQDPKARNFVSAYLDTPEEEVREKKVITVKTPARLDRPTPRSALGALFASGLSIALVGLIYLASLYAAYEIAIYRRFAMPMVMGAAAVLPVIAPVIFLCMPTRTEEAEAEDVAPAPMAEAPPTRSIPSAPPPRPATQYSPPATFRMPSATGETTEAPPEESGEEAPAPALAAKLPAPVVYQRGQTMFNRRFFETKLSGFLRMVPSDAEKDMLINVKSARGEYVGNRISKLQPDNLTLQVQKGTASSEVIIPFSEIQEVTIRHKDA